MWVMIVLSDVRLCEYELGRTDKKQHYSRRTQPLFTCIVPTCTHHPYEIVNSHTVLYNIL